MHIKNKLYLKKKTFLPVYWLLCKENNSRTNNQNKLKTPYTILLTIWTDKMKVSTKIITKSDR